MDPELHIYKLFEAPRSWSAVIKRGYIGERLRRGK